MRNKHARADQAAVWKSRVVAANDYYEKWESMFKPNDLIKAYYGEHWDIDETVDYRPYSLNLIFAAIDVRMPNLMFQNPRFGVKPRPAHVDYNPDDAHMRAKLMEDAVNYFVSGGIPNFDTEIEQALLEAHFSFGLVEVGYSANWVDNPDAGKPFLQSDKTPMTDKDGKVLQQPDLLPDGERLYVKRIPSRTFRVGGIDNASLGRCSWFGYVEAHRKEDLLALAKIAPTEYDVDAIRDMGARSPDSPGWMYEKVWGGSADETEMMASRDMDTVVIRKVWDTREKKILFMDYDCTTIFHEEAYDRVKIFPFKFRNMLDGFYPMPPVSQWVSPQAEVNETRESARIHRRRFIRKYIVQQDAFDEEEMDKLENGGDGVIVISKKDPQTAVGQMPNLNLGAQHQEAIQTSKMDFDIASGVSGEQQGLPSRTTATQAGIVEQRTSIRESRDRKSVANWLCAIAREIIMTAKDEIALPFWIKLESDGQELFDEMRSVESQFAQITSDDFGDIDFDVTLSISSISPIDQEQEKQKYIEFLSVMTNFPQISMSPTLVREAADRIGYRNERAIAEFVRMAQLLQANQLMQLSQQTGVPLEQLVTDQFLRSAGEANGTAQRIVAQQTPPAQEEINNQITNQLTGY